MTLLDPRKPWVTPAISLLLVVGGGLMCSTRIKMAWAGQEAASIASTRVSECRVLPPDQTVVLGAYYFQPGPNTYLPEGTFVCDLFGNSARIERGGYALHVVSSNPVDMNKELEKRLKDADNPDHFLQNRVQIDRSRPLYTPPPPPVVRQENNLFNLQPQQP